LYIVKFNIINIKIMVILQLSSLKYIIQFYPFPHLWVCCTNKTFKYNQFCFRFG